MRNMLPSLPTVLGLAIAAFAPDPSGAATLKTLVSFNAVNGDAPLGGLVGDAVGNLFGTTFIGGAVMNPAGNVFEVTKTFSGYANTPTALVTFTNNNNGVNGANPQAGLVADVNGNLFGTTANGGASNKGTVFEVVRTGLNSYANTPTVLVNFNGANGANPVAALMIDANGNLFGTTANGGASNNGTVFEIVKMGQGYAATPTTLVNFNGADGATPDAGVVADANGNLFGTTAGGGINNNGVVFEIAKTANGYAVTLTLLAVFTGADGATPMAGLILDANSNLFGTTSEGGANNAGTVFELVKTQNGYAGTPTVLASLGGGQAPANPRAALLADGQGNLFGTTSKGGERNGGTVFEIAKTAQGYAAAPTILVSFTGNTGATPLGSLIADAAGNLFGTTSDGGAFASGTVFQVTDSGFATSLAFAGKPGTPHCYGESVVALQQADHNLDAAAQALGLDDAEALQAAILHYCRRPLRSARG